MLTLDHSRRKRLASRATVVHLLAHTLDRTDMVVTNLLAAVPDVLYSNRLRRRLTHWTTT
jgi:hypothetical protein